jgi:hypothetical protein
MLPTPGILTLPCSARIASRSGTLLGAHSCAGRFALRRNHERDHGMVVSVGDERRAHLCAAPSTRRTVALQRSANRHWRSWRSNDAMCDAMQFTPRRRVCPVFCGRRGRTKAVWYARALRACRRARHLRSLRNPECAGGGGASCHRRFARRCRLQPKRFFPLGRRSVHRALQPEGGCSPRRHQQPAPRSREALPPADSSEPGFAQQRAL